MKIEHLLQQRQRHDCRLSVSHGLVQGSQLAAQLGGIEEVPAGIQLDSGEEQRARYHMAQASPFNADVENALAGCVVEVHRHPPHQGQGGIDHHSGGRGGQQHADHLLIGG